MCQAKTTAFPKSPGQSIYSLRRNTWKNLSHEEPFGEMPFEIQLFQEPFLSSLLVFIRIRGYLERFRLSQANTRVLVF